jgi:hypothetical protein
MKMRALAFFLESWPCCALSVGFWPLCGFAQVTQQMGIFYCDDSRRRVRQIARQRQL